MNHKRTGAYYRGYDDARRGTPADYGQSCAEQFRDYIAGYRAGQRDKARKREAE